MDITGDIRQPTTDSQPTLDLQTLDGVNKIRETPFYKVKASDLPPFDGF